MRPALIGLATMIATLAAELPSAGAQESFFNRHYCTRGIGPEGGLNCGYDTWQQCIETARGIGRYCTENPFWRPQASQRPNAAAQDGAVERIIRPRQTPSGSKGLR